MSGPVVHIASEKEFEELLSKTKHVVADFYADWCPPCKAIAPIYSKLADAHSVPGALAFAKINVDHVPGIAQTHNVTAMPTFLFFEDAKRAIVPAPGVANTPNVQVTGDGVVQIRGADPRALTAVAQALGKVAKDATAGEGSKEETSPAAAAAAVEDTKTAN